MIPRTIRISLAVLLLAPAAMAQLMDFETYLPGSVVGQDGWAALIGAGTATVVTTDNGPTLPGGQCIEFANATGEIRLRKSITDPVGGVPMKIEVKYDIKNVTNRDTTPGGPYATPTTFRTRLYDDTQGFAPVGTQHYDGGGGPASQVWASKAPKGDPGAWAPGGPGWLDANWHTVKWTLIYRPGKGFGQLLMVTFDGVELPQSDWFFADWNGATAGGVATKADWIEMRLFNDGGNDIWRVDNYSIVATPVTPPVANAGPNQDLTTGSCANAVTLDASGTTGAVRYQWFRGTEKLADVATPVTMIQLNPGTTNLTLVALAADGSADYDDVTITIPAFPPQNLPLNLPADVQVNSTYNGFTSFGSDAGDGFARRYTNEGYWGYGGEVNINFQQSCYVPLDLTAPNTYVQVTARVVREFGDYGDAPIFFRLVDSGGRKAQLENFYRGVDYPGQWKRITNTLTYASPPPADFDPTQIVKMEFWGTDWQNAGSVEQDFADISHVFIGVLTPPTADAGPPQDLVGDCSTSVMVTLDGSASVPGPGATILRYVWMEGDTVLADGASPTTSALVQGPGVHYFSLTVYDSFDLYATDLVAVNVSGGQPLPVAIPLDAQINYTGTDAITFDPGTVLGFTLENEDGVGFLRLYPNSGGWYFGPTIDLRQACYGTVDLTAPGMALRFTARYWNGEFNTERWTDTPIFVGLRDAAGRQARMGILYGPTVAEADRYPVWLTIEHDMTFSDGMDEGFDLTQIAKVEFYGTDWYGVAGDDWVDFRDLFIGVTDACAGTVLGDSNCDALVNFDDIDCFVASLIGEPVWDGCGHAAGCTYTCANDVDRSGAVNFDDIDPFVVCLIMGSCP